MNYKIQAILLYNNMPCDVQQSFNKILKRWNISSEEQYIGWMLTDLNFNKEYPDFLELNKIEVDEWVLCQGVKEKENTTILIKLF